MNELSEVGNDYIVRAIAADGLVRAFAITSKNIVENAREAHNTSPVVTAALGRLLSAGSMMGVMLKGEKDILTIQINGSGPVEGLTVTADSSGDVKGYAKVPQVIIPASDKGKLDVAGAIGIGFMNVIKDMGLKEPYVGQTVLQTSEIAEDLTFYFANSEQVPSAVGLGVLMEKNNTVKQAGGFIIQLMPFASDEIIDSLEDKIQNMESVTTLLEKGYTPEKILEYLLGDFDMQILDTIYPKFHCNCSKERVSKAVISIGKKDILDMINDKEDIEVNCHFCNKNYIFSTEELQKLYEEARD